MVSAFWTACSTGQVESVLEMLKVPSTIDIDVKDQAGSTPLIEAVRNGHAEIVKVLLEKGADSNHVSSYGPTSQLTSDPTVLDLLQSSQNKVSQGNASPAPTMTNESNNAPFYPPPPGAYPYYPNMNGQPAPHGGAYYPPYPTFGQPMNGSNASGGPGNMPPPDIARLIPCRYYPACRYGESCMFAHPPTPYFQGHLPPPAQYPAPYDPMAPQPYPPNFYSQPPPSFQPNGIHHVNSTPSPGSGAPAANSRPDGPPQQPHALSPTAAPFSTMSPISPSGYPGPVPIPGPPVAPMPAPSTSETQSPTTFQQLPPPGAFPPPPSGPVYTAHIPSGVPTPYQHNADPQKPSVNEQAESFNNQPAFNNQLRRNGNRRGSFAIRKPPCLFFPSGKCKNGNDCRFPHVIPDGPLHAPQFTGRVGAPRPGKTHNNGVMSIDSKMASMSLNNNNSRPVNGNFSQGRGGGSRPVNGMRYDKRNFSAKQKLPSADDFPVLAGGSTPPARSPALNGHFNGIGPTAAQVLQAPPPARKDDASTRAPSTRATTPSPPPKESIKEVNGVHESPNPPVKKLPLSFAAAAAEGFKDVPVSA